MRKVIFLLLICLPFTMMGQDFSYGARAGLNLSNYQGDKDGGDYKPGAYGGLFISYQINDIISLQTEATYSMLGFKDRIAGEYATISLDYITVPLLFQFTLRNYEKFKFAFGPQAGYLLRDDADPKVFGSTDTESNSESKTSSETFEDFDYGAVVGLEYAIDDNFAIQARYYIGMTEIFKKDSFDSAAKNRAFSVGAAIKF